MTATKTPVGITCDTTGAWLNADRPEEIRLIHEYLYDSEEVKHKDVEDFLVWDGEERQPWPIKMLHPYFGYALIPESDRHLYPGVPEEDIRRKREEALEWLKSVHRFEFVDHRYETAAMYLRDRHSIPPDFYGVSMIESWLENNGTAEIIEHIHKAGFSLIHGKFHLRVPNERHAFKAVANIARFFYRVMEGEINLPGGISPPFTTAMINRLTQDVISLNEED